MRIEKKKMMRNRSETGSKTGESREEERSVAPT
jgi:hypothetical protein